MTPAIIQITPDPIAFSFGPFNIGWYGIAYVVALGVLLWVSQRQAIKRGYDPAHIGNAFLIVLPLAVIGGRLYHVIDQWGPIYSQNILRIFLPPYAGLGLYGGIAGRRHRHPHLHALEEHLAADCPGCRHPGCVAGAGHRALGQLLQPGALRPADQPALGHRHRVPVPHCRSTRASTYPFETTGFHPLFFYESALDILGAAIALFIVARFLPRVRPFDIAAFWAIWYGSTRAVLETFRAGWDWTLGGIATAQWIGLGLVIVGIVAIAYNHRRGSQPYPWPAPWRPPEPGAFPTPQEEADYYAPGELPDDESAADDDDDDGVDQRQVDPDVSPASG